MTGHSEIVGKLIAFLLMSARAAVTVCHHMARSLAVHSRIRETVGGRSEAPEALAVEMYARGLSVRDIDALFADEAGNRHCIPNPFIQQGPDLDPKEPRQLL